MFDFSILEEYFPYLISGTKYTIGLSIASGLLGSIAGLALALFKMSSIRWLAVSASAFIEIIRGTPLLLQLFVVYFGIAPLLGRQTDGVWAAVFALVINSSAYIAETFRAGILAVPREQMEAAQALGLSWWQSMYHIIFPQALRNVLPPLGNTFANLIKDSSLASVIATPELMYWCNAANAQYYRIWETFITAGIIYFFLTFTLSRLLSCLEKKLRPY